MAELPEAVKAYLTSHNILLREQVKQRYPNIDQVMADPETEKTILSWLVSQDAWAVSNAELVMRCLEFLQERASEQQAPIVKTFLLHTSAFVRLRAFEFLLMLYFPDKNREAMFLLLHTMLLDPDNTVRNSAAAYIERANAVPELRDFLQQWLRAAASRGWDKSESYERVQQLLGPKR
jgi:hypothetical protein